MEPKLNIQEPSSYATFSTFSSKKGEKMRKRKAKYIGIYLLILFIILSHRVSASDFMTSRTAKPFGMLTTDTLVTIKDVAFAHCLIDEQCSIVRIFNIGKSPLKFLILIESQPEAKDAIIDYSLKIENSSGSTIFEVYWDSKITYIPGQMDAICYNVQPAALNNMQTGIYKLYANVLSADGSIFFEKESRLFAKRREGLSESSEDVKDWASCQTLSTGSDNGFLDCAADVLNLESRNNTTNGAFSNLRACLSSNGSAAIYGHGAPGEICTGNGDHCSGSDDMIAHNNGAAWIQYARTIRDKATSIKLAACKPAYGTAGANLLNKMANATNITVSGPTGLLWCNPTNKTMWIDGTWKTATPSRKASMFDEPRTVAEYTEGYFVINNKPVRIPINDISISSLKIIIGSKTVDVFGNYRISSDIVPLIDFGRPLITESIPAAIKNGELTINFDYEGEKKIIEFWIKANTILQDKNNPTYYYYIDSRLEERLSTIAEALTRD